jgi:hypothetical protein
MPDKEKSKPIKLEMPSEVLEVIGDEFNNLRSTLTRNAALRHLNDLYKQHGLQWIKDNAKVLRNQMSLLKMYD